MYVTKKVTTVVYPSDEPDEDRVHRLARAALGALPMGSGTAVELFNTVIAPPLEKRKEKWVNEVTEALNYLISNKLLTIDDLHSNDEFIDVLVNYSSQAIKTSEKEKLNLLRNALVNSAQQEVLGKDYRQHVLLLTDSLSVAHIRILRCFSGVHAGQITGEDILKEKMSNWKEYEHLYLHAYSELTSRGLIIDKEDVAHGRQIYLSLVAYKLITLLKENNEV